ncbi:hypothetical protein H0H87_007857 [Tephrocybe sp. NHM501043]|nr:hypothetical protein H0H87_007857 [Tephrocybe sp. NHM501043]
MPHLLLEGGLAQRSTKAVMDAYSDTLNKLKEVGFRINSGIKDAGLLLQLKERAGGHYFGLFSAFTTSSTSSEDHQTQAEVNS